MLQIWGPIIELLYISLGATSKVVSYVCWHFKRQTRPDQSIFVQIHSPCGDCDSGDSGFSLSTLGSWTPIRLAHGFSTEGKPVRFPGAFSLALSMIATALIWCRVKDPTSPLASPLTWLSPPSRSAWTSWTQRLPHLAANWPLSAHVYHLAHPPLNWSSFSWGCHPSFRPYWPFQHRRFSQLGRPGDIKFRQTSLAVAGPNAGTRT